MKTNILTLPRMLTMLAVSVTGFLFGAWSSPHDATVENDTRTGSSTRQASRRDQPLQAEQRLASVAKLDRLANDASTHLLSRSELFKDTPASEIPNLLSALREKMGFMGFDPYLSVSYANDAEQFRDLTLFHHLVSQYYATNPRKAMDWLQDIPSNYHRWIVINEVVESLCDQFKEQAAKDEPSKAQFTNLLEELRPLAQKFSGNFANQGNVRTMYQIAGEGSSEDFVEVAGLISQHVGDNSKIDWLPNIPKGFDYLQAAQKISQINENLPVENKLGIKEFVTKWKTIDFQAAKAWSEANPE